MFRFLKTLYLVTRVMFKAIILIFKTFIRYDGIYNILLFLLDVFNINIYFLIIWDFCFSIVIKDYKHNIF